MGPVSNKWYEDNNIPYTEGSFYSKIKNKTIVYKKYKTHYCCGRIDVHGIPDEPYGVEYGVDLMDNESWCHFGLWLGMLETEILYTLEELIQKFEKETNYKIKWFKKEGE